MYTINTVMSAVITKCLPISERPSGITISRQAAGRFHLELEKDYFNSKRWLLNRLVTGPGASAV